MARVPEKKIGQFEHPALRNASKTLLANIRFASLNGPLKTICVTSAVVNEGKSTVASNLACAMASSGKKTLIIDADMRRRSLGAMLGSHGQQGLYSILSGDTTVGRAILKTSLPNLYFLDSELDVPNPSDILSTRRFAVLLQKLRSLFDYVIIDTPPVGLFPDASVVAHLTDGTLLVVRQDGARRVDVLNAMDQLKAARAHVIGSVMTCVSDDDLDHYYSYYHSDEDSSKQRKRKESHVEDEGLAVVAADMAADDVTEWAAQAGLSDVLAAETQANAANRTYDAKKAARTTPATEVASATEAEPEDVDDFEEEFGADAFDGLGEREVGDEIDEVVEDEETLGGEDDAEAELVDNEADEDAGDVGVDEDSDVDDDDVDEEGEDETDEETVEDDDVDDDEDEDGDDDEDDDEVEEKTKPRVRHGAHAAGATPRRSSLFTARTAGKASGKPKHGKHSK